MMVRGPLCKHTVSILTVFGVLLTLAPSACGQAPQRPSYGIGAPWPEANIDRDKMVILNEVAVAFERDVSEQRVSFLVDSIAASLEAAAYVMEMQTWTQYGFRWPPDLPHRYMDVLTQLDSIPEVAGAWPAVIVGPADYRRLAPPDSQRI